MTTTRFLLFFTFFFTILNSSFSQVGINTDNPDPNSLLDVKSNSKGVLLPRVSQADLDNIKPGKNSHGLTLFNTSTNCYAVWDASKEDWMELCPSHTGLVEFSTCTSVNVRGVYDLDHPIDVQHVRIDVPVKVVAMGKYTYSAICNGVLFIATGTFTNLGPTVVSLYPSSGTPGTSGTYKATLSIGLVDADPPMVTCSDLEIRFVKRSTSTLKILNIAGDQNYTGLTATGGNTSNGTVYRAVGDWLKGAGMSVDGLAAPTALSYAEAAGIDIIDVPVTSMATLQNYLRDASIVWVGASERYSFGYAQLLREWLQSGEGVMIITGDKIEESTVADVLGYYIEDGSTATGSTMCSRLPQVFSTSTSHKAPFEVGDGLSIGYSGANCGYISANRGVVFMTVSGKNYPSAFADIDKGVFIFGDKFGVLTTPTDIKWKNFAKVLTDVFAWSLKRAPIH